MVRSSIVCDWKNVLRRERAVGLIWDEATGLWHSDGEYEKWMDKQVDEARSWASLWKRAAKKWSNWHLTPDIEGRYRCKWHQEWVFTRTERDEARAWAIRRTQERDKLKAELDESELYGKKTHQAWFHEQEQVEELREELRGECAMNEGLEGALDALQAELDDARRIIKKLQNDAHWGDCEHIRETGNLRRELNKAQAELRIAKAGIATQQATSEAALGRCDKLQAELEALKARRCETCRIWTRDDGGLATDDPAYGYYGDEDKGHCGAQDCDMEHDAFCSDWEARLADTKTKSQ